MAMAVIIAAIANGMRRFGVRPLNTMVNEMRAAADHSAR